LVPDLPPNFQRLPERRDRAGRSQPAAAATRTVTARSIIVWRNTDLGSTLAC